MPFRLVIGSRSEPDARRFGQSWELRSELFRNGPGGLMELSEGLDLARFDVRDPEHR